MEMATDQIRQAHSLRAGHADKTGAGKDHKDGNNVAMTTTSFSSKRNSEKEEERSSSPAFASDDENSSQSPKPSKKPSPKDLPQLLCDIGKVPAGLIEDAPMATSKSHIKANGSKKTKGNLKFSTKQSQKGKNNVAESLNNRSMSNANTNTVMALYEPAEVKTAQKSSRSTSLVDKQNSTIPLLINETNKFAFEEGIKETENILKNEGNAAEDDEEEDLIDCSIPHLAAESAESIKLLPEIMPDTTYTGDNNLITLDSCEPESNEVQNSPVWKRRSLVKYSASSPAIDLTATSSAVAEASYSSYDEDGGEGGEGEMTSLLQQCISQPSVMMTATTTTTPPPITMSSEITTAEMEPEIDNTAATILTMAMEEIPKVNSTASDFSPHCPDKSFQFPDTDYEKEHKNVANEGAILENYENTQEQLEEQHQQHDPQQEQTQIEQEEEQEKPQQTEDSNEQQKELQQEQEQKQQHLEEEQTEKQQKQDPQQKQEKHKLQKPHTANNQNDDLTSVTSKRNLKYSSPFQTIVKNMGKQKVRRRSKKEKTKSKSENRARKALRTITFILGAFVLCWTPYHLMVAIIGMGGGNSEVSVTLYKITYWLCYLNSPINPFCYAFANVQFKRTFLRILRFDWHRT
ncbi:muscarinic acetylcholine receptor M1-like [Octopus vulgaris]|uniref:Muscarinic acetylcholine receptor M1-like n=1 Tax=Octopus vulgaris TaxID=6645 RepID=A0AA36EYM0_OCTVU|nr:muscarinic acetylcholine receptor M1-like [Octopus vulgaris]